MGRTSMTVLAAFVVASLVGLTSGAPISTSNEGQLVPINSSSAVAVVNEATVHKQGLPVILLAASVIAWSGIETSLIMGLYVGGRWWAEYDQDYIDMPTPGDSRGGKLSSLTKWPGYGPRVKTVTELGIMQPRRNLLYWFEFLDARMMIQGCTSCVELTANEENLCRTLIATEAYITAFAVHLPMMAHWTMVELAYNMAHDVYSGSGKDMAEEIFSHLRSALLETQNDGHPHFNYHAESINSPSKVCRDVIGDPSSSSFNGRKQSSANGHYDRLIKSYPDCCVVLGLQFNPDWPFCYTFPTEADGLSPEEKNLCDEYHCGNTCPWHYECKIYQGPNDSVRRCCLDGQVLKDGICCNPGAEWERRGDTCVNSQNGHIADDYTSKAGHQRIAYSSCGPAPTSAKDVHTQLAAGAFNHTTKTASAEVKAADADEIKVGTDTDEIDVPDGVLPTPISLPKLGFGNVFKKKANAGAVGYDDYPPSEYEEIMRRGAEAKRVNDECMDLLKKTFGEGGIYKLFQTRSGGWMGVDPDIQYYMGEFLEDNRQCCDVLHMTDMPFPAATGLDAATAKKLSTSGNAHQFIIENFPYRPRASRMETASYFAHNEYMFPCGGEDIWKDKLDDMHGGDFFTRNANLDRESRNAIC